MKRTQNVLEGKYSESALKLKQVMIEGTISSSNISELTSSPNKGASKVVNYLNLAKRLNFLTKTKTRSYLQEFFRKTHEKISMQKQKQSYFSHMLVFFYKEAVLRNKIYIFNKLSENKSAHKSKQEKKKTGIKMLFRTLCQRSERNKNSAFLLIRIKIYYTGIDNIKSKQSKSQMQKTQKQQKTQSSEQLLQTSLLSPLRQLSVYDKNNFVQLTLSQLKLPIENQILKFQQIRNLSGKQLLLVVLNNHIKAIIDLTQTSSNLSVGGSSRRSFNQKVTVGMYQQLGNQFYQNDQQLNKLIIISSDFPRAQGIIQLAIKNYTSRNYRFKNNKIIQSRVKLLELLLSLLRVTNESDRVNHVVPPLTELRTKKTSFDDLEVSYVRLIVEELDQKVYELSTISEQIPQLETFKRTLDLTMPEHNVYLARIVDVLIELHHKINKLISRRPQKLLRQIQAVEQQCLIIEIATSEFLQKLESDSQIKIKPIYFDQRNNKSPDYFRKIQKNAVRMSQFILECLALEGQARYKIDQIKALVEVFWNLISGVEEYQRQWIMYKNRENKSPEQQQIIQLLQLCLKFVNDRWDKQNEEFEIQRQALMDGNTKNIQFLEQDIAKMSRQNDQLRVLLEQVERQNQQLRENFVDFEQKYKELVIKYEKDVNDGNSKNSMLEKKQKNYKDRIQSLESENQQKKVMIANITNDLKRAMKQLENSQKSQTKSRNLQQTIDELNAKIQGFEQELKNLNQDFHIVNQQKQQFQKNNQLIIKKLEEANRRITDLQNEIDTIKHKNERQKSSLKEQIEQLQRKNRKLNQQLITNSDSRSKQNQKKDTQFRNALSKKDEKISQLNIKILELNNKLNELLDKQRDIDFEFKRKQRNLQDLQNRLQQTQEQKNVNYEQLLKNYEISQKQLTLTLQKLQKSKSKNSELEQQLRRRDKLFEQRQRELEQKFQQQFHLAIRLKKQLQETEQLLKTNKQGQQDRINELEILEKQKEIKIRELQFAISINNSRINQLQSQVRIGNEQKNKLNRQLDTRIVQNQNDLKRIRQLENQLVNYDRDIRRIGELEGKLIASDRDRLRLQQLQGKLGDSQQNKNRLAQLKIKAERDRLRMQQLEGQILANDNNKQRILQLQGKLSSYDKDKQKLYQLQSKLAGSQRDKQKLQQLQSKLSASQKERQRLHELEAKLSATQRQSRLKLQELQVRLSSGQRDKLLLHELEAKLSASEREKHQLIQLQAMLQNNERDRQRLHQELMAAERDRQRLHDELVLSERERQRLHEQLVVGERNSKLKLQQLQGKISSNQRERLRAQELQAKLSASERDRQRLMELQVKLSASERDKLRLQELQAKLSGSERDRQRLQQLQGKLFTNGQRLQELESRLSTSQRERQRLQQLQAKLSGSERDKQRLLQLQGRLSASQKDRLKLQDLQSKLYGNGQRLQQLQTLLSTSDRDRQRLNQQLAARDRDRLRLQQLQAKLSASDRDKQKLKQLEQELRNQRNSDGQNLRMRADYQHRIKQLDLSLKDALGKLQKSRNLQQRQRVSQNKILQLQQQLRNVQAQLVKLRQAQSARSDQSSKIYSLESALNQKNRKIGELQNRIANLESQIRQLQRQSDRSSKILEELRTKQRQLSLLRQQISSLQSNKGNQSKLAQNVKQIEYLKQKIRSLQDLIDIFTEQHGILQAKIKQYRFREQSNPNSTASSSLAASSVVQNLSQENNKLSAQNRLKDEQISNLKKQIHQLKQNYSPIRTNNLFEDSASKSKIDESERQIRQLKQKIQLTQRQYSRQYKSWTNRQRQYLEQINRVKADNSHLNAKMKSNFNVEGDKYYLRIQGQKLEELIRRMENGNLNMNTKIDQILSNSRRSDDLNGQNIDVHVIIQQNKILIQQIRNIMRQKEQLSSVVKDYPNPDFITEYTFRIVTYFTQIHPESPQGKCIWQQLQRIRKLNTGEQYFIILEEFTKFTLQESAIEIYRKELKHKSKELELVKQRIDSLFNSEFSSERAVFEKTALTQSRIMMFREKFMNVLNVENGHSQINNRR